MKKSFPRQTADITQKKEKENQFYRIAIELVTNMSTQGNLNGVSDKLGGRTPGKNINLGIQ